MNHGRVRLVSALLQSVKKCCEMLLDRRVDVNSSRGIPYSSGMGDLLEGQFYVEDWLVEPALNRVSKEATVHPATALPGNELQLGRHP